MIYIAYFIELILQICDYAQKRRICRESCKYALDKNFHGQFCPRRKAAKFCHPGIAYFTEFTRKNDAFVAKIVNTHLTKNFMANFAPDERLPSSATLIRTMLGFTFVWMAVRIKWAKYWPLLFRLCRYGLQYLYCIHVQLCPSLFISVYQCLSWWTSRLPTRWTIQNKRILIFGVIDIARFD